MDPMTLLADYACRSQSSVNSIRTIFSPLSLRAIHRETRKMSLPLSPLCSGPCYAADSSCLSAAVTHPSAGRLAPV